MQQLVNVTYALFTENMEETEKRDFDRLLAGDVGSDMVQRQAVAPEERSENVPALMAAFRLPQAGS